MTTLDSKFWNEYFKVYDVLNQTVVYSDLLNKIVEVSEPTTGHLVLDLGSGTGNLSVMLESKGASVTGLDISPEGISLHKEKLPNAKVIESSMTDPLPFPDNCFDLVVSNNALYATPPQSWPTVCQEIFRVLKPGGRIVLSNVHEDFSPSKVLMSEIGCHFRRYGLLSTVKKLFALLPSIVKMLSFNKTIKDAYSRGTSDSFIPRGKQSALLTSAGFTVLADIDGYAGNAIITAAVKPTSWKN